MIICIYIDMIIYIYMVYSTSTGSIVIPIYIRMYISFCISDFYLHLHNP